MITLPWHGRLAHAAGTRICDVMRNLHRTISIENATLLGSYTIRLRFKDGFERSIDFGPFLRESTNPLIRAYLDRHRFAEFEVRDGDLVWGDWELCFPIADLCEGAI